MSEFNTTTLDALVAEFADKLPDYPWAVERREGVTITLDPNQVSATKLQSIGARCRLPEDRNQVHSSRYAAVVLVECCTEIRKNGELVVEARDRDKPLTFSSVEFKETFRRADAWQAVLDFFGRDGDVLAAARSVEKALGLEAVG